MAGAAGAAVLARCAPGTGGGTAGPAESAPRPSGRNVTLRYVGRGSQAAVDIQRTGIEQFQKAYPQIKVEMEVAADYLNKLIVELASGDTSDAAFTAMGSFRVLAKQGGLVELDPFMARDFKKGEYYEYAVESGKYKGKYYAVPFDGGTYALAYNTELLAKAQVKPPDDSWTWEKYVDVAAQLTVDQNGKRANESGFDPTRIAQYGSLALRGDYWYWIWANGGDIVSADKTKSTLDSPIALDTLQWMADLGIKRVVMPTPAYPDSTGPTFQNGRIALAPHGRWSVSEFRRVAQFAWDVAPMPKGKVGRVGYGWYSGMSMVRGTKAPAEAWEFCKYWAGEPGQRLLGETGQNVPAMPRLANSDSFLKSTPPQNNRAYLEAIANARIFPTAYITDITDYNNVVTPALNEVWAGQKTAKVAIPPLIPQLNDVLARG
jgi:multiple sugar transport system substrate-binding protein